MPPSSSLPAGSAGTNDVLLFPFAAYWWAYAAFVALIGAILAFDLGVFSRGGNGGGDGNGAGPKVGGLRTGPAAPGRAAGA